MKQVIVTFAIAAASFTAFAQNSFWELGDSKTQKFLEDLKNAKGIISEVTPAELSVKLEELNFRFKNINFIQKNLGRKGESKICLEESFLPRTKKRKKEACISVIEEVNQLGSDYQDSLLELKKVISPFGRCKKDISPLACTVASPSNYLSLLSKVKKLPKFKRISPSIEIMKNMELSLLQSLVRSVFLADSENLEPKMNDIMSLGENLRPQVKEPSFADFYIPQVQVPEGYEVVSSEEPIHSIRANWKIQAVFSLSSHPRGGSWSDIFPIDKAKAVNIYEKYSLKCNYYSYVQNLTIPSGKIYDLDPSSYIQTLTRHNYWTESFETDPEEFGIRLMGGADENGKYVGADLICDMGRGDYLDGKKFLTTVKVGHIYEAVGFSLRFLRPIE